MSDKSKISYERALEYWSNVPATLDGVLGGFGFVSKIDIQGSKVFLRALLSSPNAPTPERALDCGAGIGRISKFLLIPDFEVVDVVEPDEKFLNNVKEFIGEQSDKLGSLYKCSLQDFSPERKYDVIWNQWVLGHLSDKDLVSYLSRCREALSRNGVIIIKENVTSSGKMEVDVDDSSVTRALFQLLEIFSKAKLKLIKQCRQTNFPEGIYPVYMFALVPKISTNIS